MGWQFVQRTVSHLPGQSFHYVDPGKGMSYPDWEKTPETLMVIKRDRYVVDGLSLEPRASHSAP